MTKGKREIEKLDKKLSHHLAKAGLHLTEAIVLLVEFYDIPEFDQADTLLEAIRRLGSVQERRGYTRD